MGSRAQNRTLAAGMVAALDREKEKVTTVIEIAHPPAIASRSLLKSVTHWLEASGVNMAHTSIQLGDPLIALAQQTAEGLVDSLRRELADKTRQLEALQAQTQRGDTREWITMTDLADRLRVCHTTIWRAYKAGRLVAKKKGGGRKKTQYLCDPATYVPPVRKLKKTT